MNHKLDTDNQVFFYEQEFYVLSNFSSFRLKWMRQDFDTSEVAYHWTKFQGVPFMQDKLLATRSSHKAFKIAQEFKHLVPKTWDTNKVTAMYNICKEKALQHEYVMRKLLQTGTRELIEDSWRDNFWGLGPNKDGQNMLGKIWMRIREEFSGKI